MKLLGGNSALLLSVLLGLVDCSPVADPVDAATDTLLEKRAAANTELPFYNGSPSDGKGKGGPILGVYFSHPLP